MKIPNRLTALALGLASLWPGLLMLCVAAFTASCSDDNDVPVDGDTFYAHTLYVNFENADGESLVAGLGGDGDESSSDQEARGGENAIPTDRCRLAYMEPTPLPEIKQLAYDWISGKAYLNLCFTMLQRDTKTFTCDLLCERIFGDKKTHRIVAEYKSIGENRLECVACSIDGVAYDVAPGGFVTVRIDRE